MPRFNVTEFVTNDSHYFIFTHQIKQSAGDNNVGVVMAAGPCIRQGIMRHIEFWFTHIKDSTGLTQLCIQLRALRFSHTYCLGNILNVGHALWEEFNKLPYNDIQSRYPLECIQGGTIIGMLQGCGIQARKTSPRLRLSSRHEGLLLSSRDYSSKLIVTRGNFNCAALCAHNRIAWATISLSRGWRSLSCCTTRFIITCICQLPFLRF